jgi:ArsR family transcriptional regulator
LKAGRKTPRAKAAQKADQFTRIFAAFGEPMRLRIMELLPKEPNCMEMYNVVELAAELGLSQPTVSHHLKMLHKAGLVKSRRQCNSVYFYIDVSAVEKWLRDAQRRLM